MFIRCRLGYHKWGDWEVDTGDQRKQKRICSRCQNAETRILHRWEGLEEESDANNPTQSYDRNTGEDATFITCPACDGDGQEHNVGDSYDRYYGLGSCHLCGGSGKIKKK